VLGTPPLPVFFHAFGIFCNIIGKKTEKLLSMKTSYKKEKNFIFRLFPLFSVFSVVEKTKTGLSKS